MKEVGCLHIYCFLKILLCGGGGRHVSDPACGDVILGKGIHKSFSYFGRFSELGWCWRLFGIPKLSDFIVFLG